MKSIHAHFMHVTKETYVLNSNFDRCCRHWVKKAALNCFQKIKNNIQINFQINITNLVWVSCSILRQFVWQQFFFFAFFWKNCAIFFSICSLMKSLAEIIGDMSCMCRSNKLNWYDLTLIFEYLTYIYIFKDEDSNSYGNEGV